MGSGVGGSAIELRGRPRKIRRRANGRRTGRPVSRASSETSISIYGLYKVCLTKGPTCRNISGSEETSPRKARSSVRDSHRERASMPSPAHSIMRSGRFGTRGRGAERRAASLPEISVSVEVTSAKRRQQPARLMEDKHTALLVQSLFVTAPPCPQ
ncbi:hypothetical protein SKAU_G00324120 [Synaphobranchus kaupii]|uniref:Uncharacterized protein n=1 Tax=Synaphobranchus kaupii TaxID=118154 RepID=A0A9Q1EPB9_SYNKA|nr:hypothetical protein SKAU_G00324120 [Synaphobranchus kaupii]